MASYNEFVALIDQTLVEIQYKNPENGSREWILSKHISKLSENCHKSISANEVSDSIKSLMHFVIDSLDWNSEFQKKVMQISEYHSSLIKSGG